MAKKKFHRDSKQLRRQNYFYQLKKFKCTFKKYKLEIKTMKGTF